MNDFLNELAAYIDTQSSSLIYTSDTGRNLVVGKLPDKPDNCVALLGLFGTTIDDAREIRTLQFPRFQALIRATTYDAASDLHQTVRTTLHARYGVILPHWRILACHAEQEGGPIGQDDKGRYEFSINFIAEINDEDDPTP